MRTSPRSPFGDHELMQMLRSEPELLAVADALIATQPFEPKRRAAVPTRGRIASLAAALVIASVFAVFVSVSPWHDGPTFVDRAFAAVSGGPVLHVTVAGTPDSSLVELATGEVIERDRTTEIWFDRSRDLKMTVIALDGQPLDELLETSKGGFTQSGRVYTCSWIAAHPAEATKAGVSCDKSGVNPATPTQVPNDPPTLNPALENFVDNYRSALASGQARRVDTGIVDGRDVVWLEFGAGRERERVAVDARTYRPVLLEAGERGEMLRILTAESVAFDQRLFTQPDQVESRHVGSVVSEAAISPEGAARALGGALYWLDEKWNGLELVRVTRQERGLSGDGVPRTVAVIKLTYALTDAAGSKRTIDIYEASRCAVAVGWTCTARDPEAAGTAGLPLGADGWITLARSGDLYVSIWDTAQPKAVSSLEVARALAPLEAR